METPDATFFIVTGVPRSGTTLLCNLLNRFENIVCLNEIPALYDVSRMPQTFGTIEHRLRSGLKIPMTVKADGELITDTQNQEYAVRDVRVEVDPDAALWVGSKINQPYLKQIDIIRRHGFRGIAVLRDPVYAVASWNKHAKIINEANVMPEDFAKWPRYGRFYFAYPDRYRRQMEIFQHLSHTIYQNPGLLLPVWYEELAARPSRTLYRCLSWIGADRLNTLRLKPGGIGPIKNLNDPARFDPPEMAKIQDAATVVLENTQGGNAHAL